MRKFGQKLREVLRKDMVLLALCVLTSVFGIVMVAAPRPMTAAAAAFITRRAR